MNVEKGDQSILNMLFKDQYSSLEDQYNFQIEDMIMRRHTKHLNSFDIPLANHSLILHYISQDIPWKIFIQLDVREVWWEYSLMEIGLLF